MTKQPYRKPEEGEIPLSAEEVKFGIKRGLIGQVDDEFDDWPVNQRVRSSGTWDAVAEMKALRSVWELAL